MSELKREASDETEAAGSSGNGENPEAFANYSTKYQAALHWLQLGAALLPCQYNSKFLLSGFGPVRKTIKNYKLAQQYFGQNDYNLAVLLPRGYFVLDFDDLHVFQSWKDQTPWDLQATYKEITPRPGFHIFYKGVVPADLKLIAGIEIKNQSLIAHRGLVAWNTRQLIRMWGSSRFQT